MKNGNIGESIYMNGQSSIYICNTLLLNTLQRTRTLKDM